MTVKCIDGRKEEMSAHLRATFSGKGEIDLRCEFRGSR